MIPDVDIYQLEIRLAFSWFYGRSALTLMMIASNKWGRQRWLSPHYETWKTTQLLPQTKRMMVPHYRPNLLQFPTMCSTCFRPDNLKSQISEWKDAAQLTMPQLWRCGFVVLTEQNWPSARADSLNIGTPRNHSPHGTRAGAMVTASSPHGLPDNITRGSHYIETYLQLYFLNLLYTDVCIVVSHFRKQNLRPCASCTWIALVIG